MMPICIQMGQLMFKYLSFLLISRSQTFDQTLPVIHTFCQVAVKKIREREKKKADCKALLVRGNLYSTPHMLPQAVLSDWKVKIDPEGEGEGLEVEWLLLSMKKTPTELVQASD